MEEVKELKFICPECGENILVSVEKMICTIPVTNIRSDGYLDYEVMEIDNVHSEIICYACKCCSFEIVSENNFPITNCKKLAEWVEKNCSQN
jgi:hypothetical protein